MVFLLIKLMTNTIAFTHQKSGMIFHALPYVTENAEFLIGFIICMIYDWSLTGKPLRTGLDTEVVIIGTCKAASAPLAFERHLSKSHTRRNAIEALLFHGCLCKISKEYPHCQMEDLSWQAASHISLS